MNLPEMVLTLWFYVFVAFIAVVMVAGVLIAIKFWLDKRLNYPNPNKLRKYHTMERKK